MEGSSNSRIFDYKNVEGNLIEPIKMCSKCNTEKAEWFGIEDEDLCQLCWEEHCSEEWWATQG